MQDCCGVPTALSTFVTRSSGSLLEMYCVWMPFRSVVSTVGIAEKHVAAMIAGLGDVMRAIGDYDARSSRHLPMEGNDVV